MKTILFAPLLILAISISPCFGMVETFDYGTMPDGRPVKAFILRNQEGLRVELIEYGAILASLQTPDRTGKFADVTLGYDTLSGWLTSTSYFGATVGRYANRIAGGRFTLDGRTYALATNNSPAGIPCHLHGGVAGFDKRLWTGKPVEKTGASGVEFTYVSVDGEEGYPGKLTATATYWLSGSANDLTIEYAATTDRVTVVNITSHSYWNLTGDPSRPIVDHTLLIPADTMLPVTRGLIPTGEMAAVSGTPFDFTSPKRIGADIEARDDQLNYGRGYDHCWVLRKATGLRLAVRLADPASGRCMEVYSDQPGLQFYSGNFLDGSIKGKGGAAYAFRTGLCLEPERFPDSPNQPLFPSAALRPGEVYQHTIKYRFSSR